MVIVFSDRITEELITMMTDKNWKVRNEALQKVTEILKEAKFITANLGELPEALKARLSESNKNLVCYMWPHTHIYIYACICTHTEKRRDAWMYTPANCIWKCQFYIVRMFKKYDVWVIKCFWPVQQMTTITICSTLATAMGTHCKQHVRVIGPGLISCLTDSKVRRICFTQALCQIPR